MPLTRLGPDAALPRSHVFVSLARGATMRTFRVRAACFPAALVTLALLVAWLAASSLYLVMHDDLVAALMARETRMQYAYEDRIAALRAQVDHESSLNLVGRSTLDGEVRSLAQRAASLESRASLVADLASHVGGNQTAPQGGAAHPGIAARAAALGDPLPSDPSGDPLGAPTGRKPRPEARLGGAGSVAAASENNGQPLQLRLAAITEALEHVDAAQYARLATIGQRARARATTIREALATAGLSTDRLEARAAPGTDLGGPFVPLDATLQRSPFGRAVDALQTDVAEADSLARALPSLPFAKPMPGSVEITSPFGARLDPFLGRAAMHTGIDLREDYGDGVRATAAGRVVTAGPAGGYGNMVEVDHGHGLTTRYAHLSSVAVAPGQAVGRGDIVGAVGMTGRTTGPHLHYETRIDGTPVDPVRFLQAGEKLVALAAP